jgi:hypothetical protein
MKVYIYTIPKAGTYFLADFVSRLGYRDTGYHVSQNKVLDTAKFDMDTNARFPSRSMVRQSFMKTLKGLQDGDLAFGHFPVPMMAWMFPDFFFICAYRHPRKTLMSEFIDFRFRREDVRWLSQNEIADDQDAFVAYLERHGEVHMSIFSQMLGISLLRQEPLCSRFQTDRFHMLNFDAMLKGNDAAQDLAARLGVGAEEAVRALEATKAAETKTKATGLEIDRDALWSDKAEVAYARLNAEAYVTRGRELGWTL